MHDWWDPSWEQRIEREEPTYLLEGLTAHLERFPFHALAWWYLARVWERAGDLERALWAISRARVAHPYSPVLRDYAQRLRERKCSPIHPARSSPAGGLSEEARSVTALLEALQRTQRLSVRPEDFEPLPEGEVEDRARDSDRLEGPYTETLAAIYLERGDYERALRAYTWLAERDPEGGERYRLRIEEIRRRLSHTAQE
ncbi:MAG: tetratricopeptide repeat protein [Bacteroidetes bacterium]|nr:tetratricopeptide repeat protein [Bacteroidota bacterium]